ncbi:HK97 gp10 family phage protein [Clostridium tyrobutyricum]|uniref:HK97 gp10 family phage protein n=1 Tax=Clostridium tyrobutyricum TaxID=1519 RepID=UPI001C38F75B|nr:HK97 gp10 family phage protein [Clostridium tyrobutyricum]MBV4417468.1 HK97 gp10 family phage protein [Clostridium tyrobutyricum]
MEDGFDTHELDSFLEDMMEEAQEKLPKETKKFLQKEGNKLKNKMKKKAKEVGIPQNGKTDFYDRFKRGKVYKRDGELAVRAYNGSPLGHLLEKGHRLIRNGQDVGFVKGRFYIEKSTQEFKEQYYNDTEEFIDKMLKEKGL